MELLFTPLDRLAKYHSHSSSLVLPLSLTLKYLQTADVSTLAGLASPLCRTCVDSLNQTRVCQNTSKEGALLGVWVSFVAQVAR